MKKNNIIGIVLVGLAASAFLKKAPAPSGGPTSPPIDTDGIPNTDTDITVNDENTAVSGVEIERFTKEKFVNMRRTDWRMLLNSLVSQGLTLEDASMVLYQAWNSEDNPFRRIYTSNLSFLLSLIVNRVYNDNESIGAAVIEFNSVPIYPTWENYFDGIDAWSCAEWKVWHQKLEQHYNSTYAANQVWEVAWNNSNNWDYGTFLSLVGAGAGALLGGLGAAIGGAAGLFVAQFIDCRYDCGFVSFLYSKDIEIGNLLSNVSCSLQNIVKNIVGAVADTTSWIRIAVPIIVAGGAYWAYKNYLKDE